VEVLTPRSLEEALELKAERPDARPIQGGTDVMVDLNFDRVRPEAILNLNEVAELRGWSRENGTLRLGAGLTYTEAMEAELARLLPALAEASRTVGSPQIRNRGTIGGNLGTASPAGDALPVLAVYDADVVLVRAGGQSRSVPWDAFTVGVKRTTLQPDELILGTRWKVARGPGSFSKIGVRNAMIISMAGLAFQVDEDARAVRVALGSVAPTIVRAPDAEAYLAGELAGSGTWDDPAAPLGDDVVERWGEMVTAAARPIDDIRGTAIYRRHAVAVLARRALAWALGARTTRGVA
jgi:CO/xanthine dehydrogenase FAD-binding subunit